MFRMRRYRIFIVFALFVIGALYHFTSLGDIESAGAASVEGLRHFGQKVEHSVPPEEKSEVQNDVEPQNLVASKATTHLVESKNAKETHLESATPRQTQYPPGGTKPDQPAAKSSIARPTSVDEEAVNPKATPAAKPVPPLESLSNPANRTDKSDGEPAEPLVDGGGGRLEIIADSSIPKIHWSQMPEHFPVPTESIIQLPTGKPKVIPQIQHNFAAESLDEKTAREEKREIIKETFSFSWAGYKKKAWTQDELSPVSGKFRNPFCAWGATLVDSLDTLYMMGLEDEFEEAVEAVRDIDFTTTPRNDIPLFETVIRYLGGLVAAYDISDGAHRILLDKAVELADILMGAFDTPNRMPMTFYLWKPTFASQPHRAKTRVVLAELGSLSVEFTRLAQITKEAKYYDAIARITNEFEDWQNNTRMPGLWPMKVDASGCKKPDVSPQTAYDSIAVHGATNAKPLVADDKDVSGSKTAINATTKEVSNKELVKADPAYSRGNEKFGVSSQKTTETQGGPAAQAPQGTGTSKIMTAASAQESILATASKTAIGKRHASDGNADPYLPGSASKPPECEPQGLASPPFTTSEEFGIGGQADSTYEYLPKEYMLLGGLEDKYRTIYEASADVITKDLLYRTMIPDEKRRILHPGLAKVSNNAEGVDFKPEGSHLGCFAGGMYAVGAKIFNRTADMKIAKELTDGCIWAYEATTTGIMPDGYVALQCPNPVDCPWNETFYYEKLDPYGHLREQNRLAQQQSVLEADRSSADSQVTLYSSNPSRADTAYERNRAQSTEAGNGDVEKEVQQSVNAESTQFDFVGNSNNLHESKDDSLGKQSSVPEQSAVDSASLLGGGATIEQPVSSSPPGEAVSRNLRARRQLGDLDETAVSPTTKDHTTVAVTSVPSAEIEKGPTMDGTSTGPDQAKPHDTVSLARQSNGASHASNANEQVTSHAPPYIPTHEEFVKARIRDERLPVGMTKVTGARYLLRPEAIESVFIMYRATGDVYWREKGWEMFQSIKKFTSTTYGGSSILDVTSADPTPTDEMESFWLAETLKYFYLLFSEPHLVSLDDYVLNTEAHPFKRPR